MSKKPKYGPSKLIALSKYIERMLMVEKIRQNILQNNYNLFKCQEPSK